MQAIKELLKQLGGIWKELGLNQKVTVMVAAFAVFAGLIAVVLNAGDNPQVSGRLDAVRRKARRLCP